MIAFGKSGRVRMQSRRRMRGCRDWGEGNTPALCLTSIGIFNRQHPDMAIKPCLPWELTDAQKEMLVRWYSEWRKREDAACERAGTDPGCSLMEVSEEPPPQGEQMFLA